MKLHAFKNLRNRISLMGLLCFLFIPFSGWTQYNGNGTFNQITSIADLTDGYYVIADFSGSPAMSNAHTGTFLPPTTISPSNGDLTNPDESIVWKIETNEGGRTIFNEATEKYVSYTGSSNNIQVVDAVTANNQRWSVTYSDDRFLFANLQIPSRRLQYNSASNGLRFVAYGGTQRDLALYKLSVPDDGFDCPGLNANIGDSCDDNDPATENGIVVEGCICQSTPITFDCPDDLANFGDPCNDGNSNTSNDVITENCTCEGTTILVGDICGFENFNNADLTSAYADGSFVGNDGITWTYVQSRDQNNDANLSGIDGKAIMLRRVSDNSKISSSPSITGIGTFAAKLYKGFTGPGNRQVELFVNGESKGVSTPFDNFDEQVFIVENINIEGLVEIELRNITSTQIIVDDISWTCFGEPVVFDCPDQFANIGAPCDDGDDFTENDVLVEGCFCEGTEIEFFECPDFVANIGDACDDENDFTINDLITADCDCVGTPIIEGEICGSENFVNLPPTGSSYVSGSFLGNNDITWNYVSMRNDGQGLNGAPIDGGALMLRNASTGSKIFSETLVTGIGSFTTKLYKGFGSSDTRAVELFVNGELQGSFTMENNLNEQTFTVADINIEGLVVIELRHTAVGQIIVDEMTWTCFGDPVVFECPDLLANVGEPCDDGDDLTENDIVLEGCVCEGTEIIFDCPLLVANFGAPCNDNNPLTENDTVTDECDCIGTPILEGDICGFEGFDNLPATSFSYVSGNFVGNDNVTWNYVNARNDGQGFNGAPINGNAIMLQQSSGARIFSDPVSTGIGSFRTKLYKGFTSGATRTVELFVNEESKGTFTLANDFSEQIFTVNNINIVGDVTIEIRNISGGQIIVDDIAWTCFADVTPPVALCQNLTVQLDDEGSASITASDIDNGSSDDFSSVTLALDITTFICADLGENIVTLTVTDEAGNASSCEATVTVQDMIAPSVVCNNLDIYLDENGFAMVSVEDIDAGSTDNCSLESLIISGQTEYSCEDLGQTFSVELTGTDPSGNTASCTAQVTVLPAQGEVDPCDTCPGIESIVNPEATCNVSGNFSGGWFNANQGQVYCFDGAYNGGHIYISNGSTVRLSGTGTIGVTVGYNATLEILDGAEITFSSLAVNWGANGMVVYPGAFVNYHSTFAPNADVVNCGDFTTKRLQINFNGSFTNNGLLHVYDQSVWTGIHGSFVNNSETTIDGKLALYYTGSITNHCSIIVDGDLFVHRDLNNHAFVEVGGCTKVFFTGRVNQFDGAMFETESTIIIGKYTGTGQPSLVKVLDATLALWTGRIEGALSYCDADGLELVIGNNLFQNGAQDNCSIDIEATACNPRGHIGFAKSNAIAGKDKGDEFDISEFADLLEDADMSNGDLSAEIDMAVWPNPTSGNALLSISETNGEKLLLELYDTNGRLVQKLFDSETMPNQPFSMVLDLNHLENGLYYIRAITAQSASTLRLVNAK